MGLPDDPMEALAAIYQARAEGRLFAEIEGKSYVLVLYELYPNGTTSDSFVEDTDVVAAVGDMTGLGPATDPMGWGVWEVEAVIRRKQPPQEDQR